MRDSINVLHVAEPDFAEMAAEFLEREDDRLAVTTATSASDGLEQLVSEDFECIVSDYDMPGQNGIEFLKTIREDYPELPFILYTGKGSEEVASEALTRGATDYIQKDSGTELYELLANRVLNAVNQYRSQRRAAELDRIRTLASDINQALVRAESHDDIETRVCEIISDSDPYLFAWIGAVDPDTDRIEPRTSAGIDDGYLDDITITADESPTGQGPGGTAIRERRIAVSQNVAEDPEFEPRREEALDRGYRAAAAVPLEYEATLYGELVVYAERADAFDDDEQELLVELGNDIAHALHSFDVRDRLRTEHDKRLALFENAPTPVIAGTVRDDEHRISDVNTAFEDAFGYEAEEILGEDVAEILVPDEGPDRHEEFRKQATAGEPTTAEVERRTVDGPRDFLLTIIPYGHDDGLAEGWYAWYTDITERKETEQKLEQLKQHISDVVWMTTPAKDSMEFVSDAYEDVWGRSTESLRDDPLSFVDAIHPEDHERVRAAIDKQQQNPDEYEETYRVIRPDGECRWVVDRAAGVYEAGELNRIIGIATDITQRRAREYGIEALHRITDRLIGATTADEIAGITVEAVCDILELPANGIHFYDETDGGLAPVAWSDRTEEIVGKPPTFAPGEGLAGRAYETGEPQIYDDISGMPDRYNLETAVRSQIIYPLGDQGVLVIGSPEPNAFDDVDVSLAGMLANHVTAALERVERDQNLRRRRLLFEAILETSIDGILVIDENREYVTWNQQFIDMWGVPEELIGDKPEDMGLEYIMDKLEAPQEFIDKVEYLYEHPHEASRDEIRLMDGRVFDRYSAPVEADDGAYFGRVWFFRDVTDQETRERELMRQNERLEEFASVVSHDLRNPLNVAQGRIALARDEVDSEHLGAAANAVDRSLELVDDLLSLARGGEELREVETIDLGRTIAGCWANLETANATLVNGVSNRIRADPGRLKQLLENLMRNAIDHGGAAVTVTIGDLDDGFFIADDGPGIPEDERDQVFEAGYSTRVEGTGFGLNIVTEIVEAHDWEISVGESEDGGARFEITDVVVSSE